MGLMWILEVFLLDTPRQGCAMRIPWQVTVIPFSPVNVAFHFLADLQVGTCPGGERIFYNGEAAS